MTASPQYEAYVRRLLSDWDKLSPGDTEAFIYERSLDLDRHFRGMDQPEGGLGAPPETNAPWGAPGGLKGETATFIEVWRQHAEDIGADPDDLIAYDLGRTWSRAEEYRKLSENIAEDWGEEEQEYFDHESRGRDLVLGGDYSIYRYKDGYMAVSNQ